MEHVQFALLTLTSILFIVNPISVIPTYLVITQKDTAERRARTARRACISAAAILIAFAVAGRQIFSVFGITIDAFRVAGGLILWVVAMDMLHGERRTQEGQQEITEGATKEDVALAPLAMPMLAGPGAISTIMVLSSQASGMSEKIAVFVAILVTMAIAWIVLRVGDKVVLRMGETGIRVMTRIMGLLLAAIAMQFVISGASDAWHSAAR
ncbi:MAG TPA: NAAT family transporter [Gemmatimonadaceae bacterium]